MRILGDRLVWVTLISIGLLIEVWANAIRPYGCRLLIAICDRILRILGDRLVWVTLTSIDVWAKVIEHNQNIVVGANGIRPKPMPPTDRTSRD